MPGENELRTTERIAYTFTPVRKATVDFVKGLLKGKTIKQSAHDVNSTFTAVQEYNRKKFKENIHKTSEEIDDKLGNWKYLFSLIPRTIQTIDKATN